MLLRPFSLLLTLGLFTASLSAQTGVPGYSNVTAHDPSVIRVGNAYYVFGSHLAAAKTHDLMSWQQVADDYQPGNPLIPNYRTELAEALAWSGKTSLWAPDVVQLENGRFYMYYCASEETAPRASIGIATADNIEGPYSDEGIILQSGMWGQPSPDGRVYDANHHPHAIDAHTFFDAEGRLWMVYGSYSGGIFIMEMNPTNGRPLPGQGYGKHLWGGNHARIEGPYILYNPETAYYYLFISYGGLDAVGAYHIRVARSRDPGGPYLDAAGVDMATVKGTLGAIFDDEKIAPYGVKLLTNARFLHQEGEPRNVSTGYVSPGHNSAYHDAENGKYYLFFHSRFVGRGEQHEVRVHQIYFNEDGWPVVAPHRYAHETRKTYAPAILHGDFKLILHDVEVRDSPRPDETPKFVPAVNESQLVTLQGDGTVTGAQSGTWRLDDGQNLRIKLAGTEYRGVVSHQWDEDNRVWVMAFSALSADGTALWGSEVASARSSLEMWREIHFGDTANAGEGADFADPDGDGLVNLLEYALRSNPKRAGAPETLYTDVVDDRLRVVFERIMDPALRYEVRASEDLQNWSAPIWSSSGNENQIGVLAVEDDRDLEELPSRFLSLEVKR